MSRSDWNYECITGATHAWPTERFDPLGHIEDKRLVLGVVIQYFKGDNVAPAFTAVRVHRRREVRAIFVHFLDVDLCFPQEHVEAVWRHLKMQAHILGRHVERGL